MTTIRLVPLAEEHEAALLETMRDPDVLRFTRTPDPMPEGWVHEYVERFRTEDRGGWAILDGEEFVGYAVTGPSTATGSRSSSGTPSRRGAGAVGSLPRPCAS